MSMIQKQTLLKAIKEPLFAKEIFSKLPIKAFDGEKEYGEIVLSINRYYQTNNEPLDENTFLTLVEERLDRKSAAPDKISDHMKIASGLYKVEPTSNTEVVDEQIDKFVKKTLTADLIMNTLRKGELSDDGVIEELSAELKRIAIMSSSSVDGSFFDFFNDVDRKRDLYKNMRTNRFSTGFSSIDAISDGGLARGELGLINAISGGGKSTISVQLASNYTKRSMNVLYVVLEEKLDRMSMKIEQNLLNIPKSALMDKEGNLMEEVYDKVQDLYKSMPNLGNLYLSKHKPQEVTITMLEQVILDASIRNGVHIDAVIIDYPDLMKNHHLNNTSESDAGGKLYEDIRALSQKYDFVCWVLSQLNRSAYNMEVRTAEAIEGSKKKLNAVEIAMTINQTPEEKQEGFLRLHIDKVRYQDGKTFDPIQVFRVDKNGYVIRDATPDEINENRILLKEAGREGAAPENKYEQVMEKVTNINNNI